MDGWDKAAKMTDNVTAARICSLDVVPEGLTLGNYRLPSAEWMAAWDEANGDMSLLARLVTAAMDRLEGELRSRAIWRGVPRDATLETVVAACEAADRELAEREAQQTNQCAARREDDEERQESGRSKC